MFGKFFSYFSHDIGIDLGTANTLIWVKDKGIVIREPSVVAMHKKTKKIIAIGTEAKRMVGKTPPSIITVSPLKGGVIADFDATLAMISYYIQVVHEVGNVLPVAWSRPRVVIGIPSSVTEVERRAVWEAALFAGHHKLSNLVAIVDYNKIQSYGRTDEILTLEPFGKKWESFGWAVREVDGHNISSIEPTLKNIPFVKNKPSVLIAHTIKGYKGVAKHVDQVSSHYKPPTEEEYKEAIKKLS